MTNATHQVGASERPLRIAINARRVEGPYGGANRFAGNVDAWFRAAGHSVSRSLERNLDLILIVASHDAGLASFPASMAIAYRQAFPRTVLVQRVNACDEQRGFDQGRNRAIRALNRYADHTVFVSEFMREFWAERGIDRRRSSSTILTGADRKVFHPRGSADWDGFSPFRLVTHHWSANYLKGFDVYERLDAMLAEAPWRDHFEFTFVGNLPLGCMLRNTRVLEPRDGDALADTLREHHGYVTAARFEPGGNHYIEAMQCGLPVLHLAHGSLPEYCAPYGVTFSLTDFEHRLVEMRNRYRLLREAVLRCTYDDKAMADEFLDLAERLCAARRASPIGSQSRPLRFHMARAQSAWRSLRERLSDRIRP